MKVKILSLFVLFLGLISTQHADAQISKVSFKEPMLGCALFGGVAYGLGQSGQTMALSCVAGAFVFHSAERYYTNTISDRYEREIVQLQHQLDEFVINRAMRSRRGEIDDSDIVIKHTIIPSRRLDDGSYIHEGVKSTLTLPGAGHRIGE